jgi:hypothetical protein
MPLQVIVTGLNSDANPSPGIGTARSLRAAFPDARIVGWDYSYASTGLHWPDLDDVCVFEGRFALGMDRIADAVRTETARGAYLLSGLDVEARWLAAEFAEDSHVLSPSTRAFAAIAKNERAVPAYLGIQLPPLLSSDEPTQALHAFCRRHGWRIWVKGLFHEALPARSPEELHRAVTALRKRWGDDHEVFVQSHVSGTHVSVAFAAYNGELVGAALLNKLQVTSLGKTWSGAVDSVGPRSTAALGLMVRELAYTGGGEIEMIRDESGQLWLIDLNPRFPAWIHGATLAGINLPGALVARASGVPARDAPTLGTRFARVVIEVAMR